MSSLRLSLPLVSCSLALGLVLACGDEQAPAAEPARSADEAEARAAGASDALLRELQAKLAQALAQRPAEEALDVCADAAQELTARIGRETGTALRRTTLRWRNPGNAPDSYERQWLEAVSAEPEPPDRPTAEVIDLPDGGRELRYLRPLYVQEPCLQCHGPESALSAEVRAALRRRYPEDRATGYAAGDLRGVVSVRVALAQD